MPRKQWQILDQIYPFQIDLILYRSICRTELIEGQELHVSYRIAKLE
jgi:hypothetical protein